MSWVTDVLITVSKGHPQELLQVSLGWCVTVPVKLCQLPLQCSCWWCVFTLQLPDHWRKQVVEAWVIVQSAEHNVYLSIVGQATYNIVASLKVGIRSYTRSSLLPELLWLPLIVDELHIPVPMLSIFIKQVSSQSYAAGKGLGVSTTQTGSYRQILWCKPSSGYVLLLRI